MDYSSSEVKVGVVVTVAFGLLVAFLVAIFGVEWKEDTKIYYTHLNNIPGIVTGSLVKYGGMDVGQVTEVQLAGPNSRNALIGLKLEVAQDTPVRTTSEAFVTSVGVMADQHIEISSGTPDSEVLQGGSVLVGRDVLSFMQMAEPMGEVSDQMQELLVRVGDLFNDENRAELSALIRNFNKIAAEGGEQFINLTHNLDELTKNMASISEGLDELMTENRGNLDSTLTNIAVTTRKTSELIGNLQQTLGQFEVMMSANGASIVEIMENFQFASQNLEEFSRIVKERPWLLVRKSAPPKRKLP